MLKLPQSLKRWHNEDFERVLRDELLSLGGDSLPLQQATVQGGLVDHASVAISILGSSDDANSVSVKIGVFFNEIVGGCNCHDDPYTSNAYCEMHVSIDKRTAKTAISLAPTNGK